MNALFGPPLKTTTPLRIPRLREKHCGASCHWQQLAWITVALSLLASGPSHAQPPVSPTADWRAEWIGVIGESEPNTWLCFRKTIDLADSPEHAVARIACDSKYWLWINGKLVIFEGQLKRGPTPQDTYFDTVNLSPHLRAGTNTLAILVCHFGRHGYSHNSSGTAALLFDADVSGQPWLSDRTWRVRKHPSFTTTDPPLDNIRLPEANLRFDARRDMGAWQQPEFDDRSWEPSKSYGRPPCGPWNQLYPRPIPLLRDSGLVDYVNAKDIPQESTGQAVVCQLDHNCHVTPYLQVEAPEGLVIGIATDVQKLYGRFPKVEVHRHEYVTRRGIQEFELPHWINGHEVHYTIPRGVRIIALKYRETGYDTRPVGLFNCNDPALNQLWEESCRTLYVTMRDTYMDCPDRERAQWWGDVVNELGESFYAFEAERAPLLTRKAIYELSRWQLDDGTLYSPVPSGKSPPGVESPVDGSCNQELPQQMLASVGWYGIWTYYWYSGDRQTIVDVYPSVRRYLRLWKLGVDGLVVHRAGGWDWTDWGDNIDTPVVENAWYYLALKGAAAMADLTDNHADIPHYQQSMRSIEVNYNESFWQGDHYRSSGHSGEIDDRAQAMAVVAGLANEDQYAAIAKVLAVERHASPYLEKYVLESLFLMGRPDLAMQRMKDRYAPMLTDKQTTLWECFDEMVLEGFGSLGKGTYNHAWSGGPLTILSQYLAGIAPTEPAFKSYHVLPQIGKLRHVKARVPTKYGTIDCTLDRTDAAPFTLQLTSPAHTSAVVGIPVVELSERTEIALNDRIIWRNGQFAENKLPVTFNERDERHIKFNVPAGSWRFHLVKVPDPDSSIPNGLTAEECEDHSSMK